MGTVTIQGIEFRPRRLTGRGLLALTEAQQAVDDAEDVISGIDVQLGHLAGRLNHLADTDGEFDAEARDRLNRERKALRAARAAAQGDQLRAQMGVMLASCEAIDGIDVEWCLDNIAFPGDFEAIMQAGSEIPPTSPAPEGSSS